MPVDAGDGWPGGGADAVPCVLVRIRNESNVRRYYLLDLQDNLFGGVTLVREWGRLGGGGQRRLVFFDERQKAVRAAASLARAKIRRGYRQVAGLPV
ncbi:MAG: WGR domain-containing protein [bacterium]|nr:WGR domain-containing protein [bacterium]